MGCIKDSRCLGVNCGKGCAGFMVFLSVLYLLVCLAFSLTMRIYMKAYYTSAYVAGLGVIVALFVLAHHLFRVRVSLGCKLRPYNIVQSILNFFFLLCNLALATAYTLIFVVGLNWNFDYAAALIVGWLNVIFMLYLFVLTVGASRRDRYNDYKLEHNPAYNSPGARENSGIINYYQMHMYGEQQGNGHPGAAAPDPRDTESKSSLMTASSKSGSSKCAACCKGCWNFLFGLFYFLAMLILIVVFALSACHPAFLAVDTFRYRESEHMYTVEVEGHRPLNLFFKCQGNGSETVLFENGLGGLAYMYWNFIPKYMAESGRFKVCVYDRRGYGFSETLEYDFIDALVKEPQWSKPNTKFLKELVKVTNISTPFYYMGHSYGGHHMVYTALDSPELVKGLIFLDSASYNVATNFRSLYEVINNFQGTGLLYILLETEWIDYKEMFKSVIDFGEVPADVLPYLLASLRSGYYFASERRESWPLIGEDKFAKSRLEEALTNRTIPFPVLLLDKDGRNETWFPAQHFTAYDKEYHLQVPCSDHQTLVLSQKFGNVVSQLASAFILIQEGERDKGSFSELKMSVIDRIGTCTAVER